MIPQSCDGVIAGDGEASSVAVEGLTRGRVEQRTEFGAAYDVCNCLSSVGCAFRFESADVPCCADESGGKPRYFATACQCVSGFYAERDKVVFRDTCCCDWQAMEVFQCEQADGISSWDSGSGEVGALDWRYAADEHAAVEHGFEAALDPRSNASGDVCFFGVELIS